MRRATNTSVIVRERLLAVLRDRWSVRSVAVVAGAGFGKSTLLDQMLRDALVSGMGVDVVVRCGPDDAHFAHFARRLRDELGIEGTIASTPAAEAALVAAHLATRSPLDVCVVVDDAQRTADGDASELIDELHQRLPSNAHLLVLSRRSPTFGIARDLASGNGLLLEEHDLEFSGDEWNAATGSDDSSPPVTWPALAMLQARAGHRPLVSEFVWREVLDELPEDAIKLLALLSLVGGGDRQLAIELMGREVAVESLLDGVPLIRFDGVRWTPHDLWGAQLRSALSASERARALHLASDRAFADGDHSAAFRLADEGCAPDRMGRSVQAVCAVIPPAVPRRELVRWSERLDVVAPNSPDALYLRAKLALDAARGQDAIVLFREAGDLYREAGTVRGELNAIVEICVVSLSLGDLSAAIPLLGRLQVHADGGAREAIALVGMGQALFAPADQPDLVVDAWRSIRPPDGWFRTAVRHQLLMSLCAAGRLDEAERGLASATGLPDARALETDGDFVVRVLRGDIAQARELVKIVESEALRLGFDWRKTSGLQKQALLDVLSGLGLSADWADDETSGLHLNAHERAPIEIVAAAESGLWNDDVERALRHDDPSLGLIPTSNRQFTRMILSAAFAVARASRPATNEASLDRCESNLQRHAFGRYSGLVTTVDAAASVVVGEAPSGAGTLPVELACSVLVPRLRVAAAVAAQMHCDHDRAWKLIETVDAAQALGHLSSLLVTDGAHSADIGSVAADLMERIGRPPDRLQLSLLGPFEVRRLHQPDTHSVWKRSRVRQLFALLLLKRRISRSEACDALWPELDEAKAANNLRVTLSYLLEGLEPDRRKSERSAFIDADSIWIQLRGAAPLDVDVWSMELAVADAQAAEREGQLSGAVASYETALSLYTDNLLANDQNVEWLFGHRERLAQVATRCATRSAELRLAAGQIEIAQRNATRAVQLDPWSEAARRVDVAIAVAAGDRAASRERMNALLSMLHELGVEPERATSLLCARVRGDNAADAKERRHPSNRGARLGNLSSELN
jgi:LuxR family transcriptional regulator, maltose regulon positive regulatory protein